MVQKLEDIKGGGGSIKVGTTGTIGALMMRELDSTKSAPQTPISSRAKTNSVSVACSVATPRRLQARKSYNEASSSGSSSSSGIHRKNLETHGKLKSNSKSSHQVPMLGSDNITLERTPSRKKINKKATNIVEIVDVKCGQPDRLWPSPITSKLKKLGFSKLSESIV